MSWATTLLELARRSQRAQANGVEMSHHGNLERGGTLNVGGPVALKRASQTVNLVQIQVTWPLSNRLSRRQIPSERRGCADHWQLAARIRPISANQFILVQVPALDPIGLCKGLGRSFYRRRIPCVYFRGRRPSVLLRRQRLRESRRTGLEEHPRQARHCGRPDQDGRRRPGISSRIDASDAMRTAPSSSR
jgi:hypothetical protein